LSDRALDTAKGVRSLLQDILAPSLGKLEARVEALAERCERLADEIKENRNAHQALLAYLNEQLASLGNRIGKLEGRSEGLKTELVAVLQMEILKASQRSSPQPEPQRLLSPGEESDPDPTPAPPPYTPRRPRAKRPRSPRA
jgi:chromosome segregation ATPase